MINKTQQTRQIVSAVVVATLYFVSSAIYFQFNQDVISDSLFKVLTGFGLLVWFFSILYCHLSPLKRGRRGKTGKNGTVGPQGLTGPCGSMGSQGIPETGLEQLYKTSVLYGYKGTYNDFTMALAVMIIHYKLPGIKEPGIQK